MSSSSAPQCKRERSWGPEAADRPIWQTIHHQLQNEGINVREYPPEGFQWLRLQATKYDDKRSLVALDTPLTHSGDAFSSILDLRAASADLSHHGQQAQNYLQTIALTQAQLSQSLSRLDSTRKVFDKADYLSLAASGLPTPSLARHLRQGVSRSRAFQHAIPASTLGKFTFAHNVHLFKN